MYGYKTSICICHSSADLSYSFFNTSISITFDFNYIRVTVEHCDQFYALHTIIFFLAHESAERHRQTDMANLVPIRIPGFIAYSAACSFTYSPKQPN